MSWYLPAALTATNRSLCLMMKAAVTMLIAKGKMLG